MLESEESSNNLSVVGNILDKCERSGVKSKGHVKNDFRVCLLLALLRTGAAVEKEVVCLQKSWCSRWWTELTREDRPVWVCGGRPGTVSAPVTAFCCYFR